MEIHLKELRVKWGGRSKSASGAATQRIVRLLWVVLGVGVLLLCCMGLYSKGLIRFGPVGVAASPSEDGARLEGQVQWKVEYQDAPGSRARGQ